MGAPRARKRRSRKRCSTGFWARWRARSSARRAWSVRPSRVSRSPWAAGSRQQVVVGQRAGLLEPVETGEAADEISSHGDGDRSIQRDDRMAACLALEHAVEGCDLGPVGGIRGQRLGVQGRDGGLDGVGREGAGAQGVVHHRQGFADAVVVPSGAVLVLEPDQLAVAVDARRGARVMQQQERQQGPRRLIVGQQRAHQPGHANGLVAQLAAHQAVSTRGAVAFIEDQIDRAQYAGQALGKRIARRHRVGDARAVDLALGPHQPLLQGGPLHQKGPRHLVAREPTDGVQRERDLGVRGQRGVAAGEDQPQHVVGDFVWLESGRPRAVGLGCELRCLVTPPRLAPIAIDGAVSGHAAQPSQGLVGDALLGPQREGLGEDLLGHVFGCFEAAEDSHQRRQHVAVVRAMQVGEGRQWHPGAVRGGGAGRGTGPRGWAEGRGRGAGPRDGAEGLGRGAGPRGWADGRRGELSSEDAGGGGRPGRARRPRVPCT